jgi:hypothetical protein
MPDYVTISANFEATGSALTASELEPQRIHRPDPAPASAQEVVSTQTTT